MEAEGDDLVVELFNPSDATVALEEGIPVAQERRPEGQQEKLAIAWLDEVSASAAHMMAFIQAAHRMLLIRMGSRVPLLLPRVV